MSCNEWKKVKFSDVVEMNPKITLKKGTLAKKVSMRDLKEFNRKIQSYKIEEYKSGTKFQNGDTLFARITPCLENGKTAYVDILEENEVAFGSTEFIVLREKSGITDDKFVYYLSISPDFRNLAIKSMTGTSGRQRVQNSVLANTLIKIPSLKEQKRIATILSTLDDKIELNNQINKTLEQIAQTIFKHWFIDFEFPNEEGKPYKSSGGKFVESELGLIPECWEVKIFNDISLNFDSQRVPLSSRDREKKEKIYPYYGAASIIDYVDDFIFDGTYVLMGEDGTVIDEHGYPILQYVWGKFWVNNHAHVLQGKFPFSTEYIYLLLKNTNVSSIVTGAVQPKINQKNLNSIKVVIPPETLLKRFNEIVLSIFNTKKCLVEQNNNLISIRDTLLPKLMSGEIRVPEAEEVVENYV